MCKKEYSPDFDAQKLYVWLGMPEFDFKFKAFAYIELPHFSKIENSLHLSPEFLEGFQVFQQGIFVILVEISAVFVSHISVRFQAGVMLGTCSFRI